MSGSDARAQQQQQQSADGEMRRLPFPVEWYAHPSPPLNSSQLFNFYIEDEPDNSRTTRALRPTPGLFPADITVGSGPILALNTDRPGIIYAISGDHAYRITYPFGGNVFSIVDLGYVGVATGDTYAWELLPTIASGTTAVVFCVPPNAYTCGHFDTSLNQIGGDFPGARSVTYIDGYFVFTSDDQDAQFFITGLYDPSSVDALDFAYADGVPNLLKRCVTLSGHLWLLGDAGIEVWYDAGVSGLETSSNTSFFPFQRIAGAVIPFGVASIKTVALLDNSVFWVANEGFVFRNNGYNAERISTYAIESLLREQGTPAVVSAFGYTQDGHAHYCLTYGAFTLCYDCATKKWHTRGSPTNPSGAWLPIAACMYGNRPLFGTAADGRLFDAIPFLDSDDGHTQRRIFTMPPLWATTRRAFCSRLEVELDSGDPRLPAAIAISWSDDGGYTWTPGRVMDSSTPHPPGPGPFRKRVFTTRLGSFRQRVYRFLIDGHTTIYAVDAEIVAGAH